MYRIDDKIVKEIKMKMLNLSQEEIIDIIQHTQRADNSTRKALTKLHRTARNTDYSLQVEKDNGLTPAHMNRMHLVHGKENSIAFVSRICIRLALVFKTLGKQKQL